MRLFCLTAAEQGIFTKDITFYLIAALKVALILLAARIAVYLIKKLVTAIINKRIQKASPERQRYLNTLKTVTVSLTKYAVIFIAVAACLGEIGLLGTMNAMLAAAGIGGIAIGIGAQGLIKDILSGTFMLFEDQISVGDYVKVGDIEGTVESVAIRTLTVRGFRGEQNIIPNGSIAAVTNYSRSDILTLVDIPVSLETDMDAALDVMFKEAEALKQEKSETIDGVKRIGVVSVSESSALLRVGVTVKPMMQWEIQRELSKRVLARFIKENIQTPNKKIMLVKEKKDD